MSLAHPFRPYAPGRHVDLPGRGATWIRELPGPAGAPNLVLLHGWTATGGVNWDSVMPELAKRFNVVTIDHRGHGRGLRSQERFSLEACADDVAAMMRETGRESAIVAGYSMGGPIAQLLAYRHPELVSGLVMCATAARFPQTAPVAIPLEVVSRALEGVERISGQQLNPLASRNLFRTIPVMDDLGRHDPHVVAQCGPALAAFNATRWLGSVGIPASSVITTKDQLVAPLFQRELARLLHAEVFKVEALSGHFVAAFKGPWAAQLGAACESVAQRAAELPPPAPRLPGAGLGAA